VPTTHDGHELWPAEGCAVPPGQSTHVVAPVPAANRPDKHDVHEATLCANTREQAQK
jgi:hypothetical protein